LNKRELQSSVEMFSKNSETSLLTITTIGIAIVKSKSPGQRMLFEAGGKPKRI